MRVTPALVAVDALTAANTAGEGEGESGQRTLLACHARAPLRGSWQVDQAHWDGLPDGHTRATTIDPGPDRLGSQRPGAPSPLLALLADHHRRVPAVAHRSLATYRHLGEQLLRGTSHGQVSA